MPEYDDEIARQIDAAWREYIESDQLGRDIRQAVNDHAQTFVVDAVKEALEDAILSPGFRQSVEEALAQRLAERGS